MRDGARDLRQQTSSEPAGSVLQQDGSRVRGHPARVLHRRKGDAGPHVLHQSGAEGQRATRATPGNERGKDLLVRHPRCDSECLRRRTTTASKACLGSTCSRGRSCPKTSCSSSTRRCGSTSRCVDCTSPRSCRPSSTSEGTAGWVDGIAFIVENGAADLGEGCDGPHEGRDGALRGGSTCG